MDPHGNRLIVSVSATQARRRLKGRGLGVRKIHSGGRNQAVIIHTATGENLAELELLFRGAINSAEAGRLDESDAG